MEANTMNPDQTVVWIHSIWNNTTVAVWSESIVFAFIQANKVHEEERADDNCHY